MGNHIQDILEHWHPKRDLYTWVLGTVIDTEGSSYRKAGAMMMFNDRGEFFGLLSGGCLEKALFNDVKKVISFNQARVVEFDSTGDTDVAWQLGLGCGGKVRILLQPVLAANQYQHLCALFAALNGRQKVQYGVNLALPQTADLANNRVDIVAEASSLPALNRLIINTDVGKGGKGGKGGKAENPPWLTISLTARRHLAIFGGGVDAVPLVHMAKNLGWQLTLIDHRVAYAQAQHFSGAERIIRQPAAHLDVIKTLSTVDAAFVMTHNVQLDADALSVLLPSQVQYIGLLGPVHRKNRVLIKAGLKPDSRIHGPMGLDLGGELPESIALAALAQCHQMLEAAQPQRVGAETIEQFR